MHAARLTLLVALSLAFGAEVHAATITVTTLADESLANGDCSLREAIASANDDASALGCVAGDGEDRIEFAVAGEIALASDLPPVTDTVDLVGPGPDDLTVNGADLHELFRVGQGTAARVQGITFRDGFDPNTAPIYVALSDLELRDVRILGSSSDGNGGGIFVSLGTLDLVRVTIDGNETGSSGGGIYSYDSVVRIRDSTISNNSSVGVGGGLMAANGSEVTIERSTLSLNATDEDGGAVALVAGNASVSLTSSTVHANLADADGADGGVGGGLYVSGGTMTVANSIVAGNSVGMLRGITGSDLFGSITSEGFNLIGENDGAAASFPAGQPNANDDQVGTSAAPIAAGLEGLGDNGGPTATHALVPGSPAVDQGSCTAALVDQRGFNNLDTGFRIVDAAAVVDADDGCDVGALERGAGPIVFRDGFEDGDSCAWSLSEPVPIGPCTPRRAGP